MKKNLLAVVAFYLLQVTPISARSISDYRSAVSDAMINYYGSVSKAGYFKPFERSMTDLMEEMDNDLKSGSELSFDEMNELRSLKSKINTMVEFGDGISQDGFSQVFNGATLRKIQELFPEIQMAHYTDFKGCITVHKIKFREYVSLVLRHNRRNELVKVSWVDSSKRCKTIGGSVNVLGGYYRTMWINTENCPGNTQPVVSIVECEFQSVIKSSVFTVKPFVD